MKILCVFGTRPEAIKMAPVVRALRGRPDVFETKVCITAQHRRMLDQVISVFELTADHDLDLMRPNQGLSAISAAILTGIDEVLVAERPDWVLVQGDTTTVMATALAAFHQHVRIGHVEAGLRSHDRQNPFPEEVNRRVASVVADLHFAPTPLARENLLREGIADSAIRVTGNTVIDALQWAVHRPHDRRIAELMETVRQAHGGAAPRIILVTAHRRENFGEPFARICDALSRIAREFAGVHLVYPVHLNPNVHDVAHERLDGIANISLIEPLDYLPLVQLMREAFLVLTDSGGLQEEAPGLAKPVLVLREVTERPEGVDAGCVRLVGTDTDRIVDETRRLLNDANAYTAMAQVANPYGDGGAAERIVAALLERAPESDRSNA